MIMVPVLWPHVPAACHSTQPRSAHRSTSPCHALTTCTAASHPPHPRWIQMILGPGRSPCRFSIPCHIAANSQLCLNSTRCVPCHPICKKDRVTQRRFGCMYGTAFFPVVIHSFCLPRAMEVSCDSTAGIFVWNRVTSLMPIQILANIGCA